MASFWRVWRFSCLIYIDVHGFTQFQFSVAVTCMTTNSKSCQPCFSFEQAVSINLKPCAESQHHYRYHQHNNISIIQLCTDLLALLEF